MDSEDEATNFLAFGQSLIEPRGIKASGEASIDFGGLLTPSLRLHEDLAEGCGGQLWPAGMVLVKYMLRHIHLTEKKTMFVSCDMIYQAHKKLMLGQELNLELAEDLLGELAVALALQKSFSSPLHITDQLAMLALMQKNIALNELQQNVEASVYNWGERPPENIPKNPDIILAADCVYFEPAFPLLQETMRDLIGENTVCYFCFKKRRRADLHFVKTIRKMFKVEEVDDDPDKEIYSRESLFLYKITKR